MEAMRSYLIKRVLLSVPVAVGVLVLVFALIHLIPGDPVDVMLGESAQAADRAALREALKLDDPLYEQFGYFVADLFTGKLESIFYHRPVLGEVMTRLGATAELALAALVISLLVSVPLGVAAAVKKGSGLDAAAMGFSLVGVSMPNFWLGPMLILLFSIKLGWAPVSGQGGLSHLALPALTLGLGMAAIVSRMVRGSLLDVMKADYLRTARAKGLAERSVILRHALRNALIPAVTIVGLQAGALLSGAIITETIFAWPGIGRLLIEAIQARDFPLVQGAVIVIALSYVLINLATDVAYALIDPRVRFEGAGRER
ncbi:MAG TPA: ABC transporter permease [bacterium]|nr:ABC transporter permease [bacterium]